MITAGELAVMRLAQAGALPDTCTIRRATPGVDSIGQPTLSWSDQVKNVACRLSQRRAVEEVAGERVVRVTGWVLTVAHGTDLTAADRVKVGARTFEVVGVSTGQSWSTAVRAELVEVT